MLNPERLQKKLTILADAAKYDVSCSSSGGKRANQGGLGNSAKNGICHTYTEDGRCVSLLKILLTNHCIYDCAYCVSRKSNDTARAAFTVEEVVALTMNFYRRNYIEGLFLSSGIFKNPDYTMERLILVAKTLREKENFHGYIHLKTIPKASSDLIKQAGLYADRLSINMEIPTQSGLALLAPEKHHQDMITPMKTVRDEIIALNDSRKYHRHTPRYAPAGQSTQFIVGASQETDRQIIRAATKCYQNLDVKRVYYSGYVPMLSDKRLPEMGTAVPELREHRLYQADWLMRFYGFDAEEITSDRAPNLATDIDPKLAWALRNRDFFPVLIQYADLRALLRVPGIGNKTAKKIIQARKHHQLDLAALQKMGAAINRARYFIRTKTHNPYLQFLDSETLKIELLKHSHSKYHAHHTAQLTLFP